MGRAPGQSYWRLFRLCAINITMAYLSWTILGCSKGFKKGVLLTLTAVRQKCTRIENQSCDSILTIGYSPVLELESPVSFVCVGVEHDARPFRRQGDVALASRPTELRRQYSRYVIIDRYIVIVASLVIFELQFVEFEAQFLEQSIWWITNCLKILHWKQRIVVMPTLVAP